MTKIIYEDREKAASSVRFHGIAFTHGEAVEVGEGCDELVEMAQANPFFEVLERHDTIRSGKPTPRQRGRLAAENGKPRSVPLAYRGKDAATQWLAGYDAGLEAG